MTVDETDREKAMLALAEKARAWVADYLRRPNLTPRAQNGASSYAMPAL